ncbi:hypothetical protein HK101_001673 [Irineochytrium annulatum]|nr:hypothetical protein HK101_001673 [Irineochytrium annulatum]
MTDTKPTDVEAQADATATSLTPTATPTATAADANVEKEALPAASPKPRMSRKRVICVSVLVGLVVIILILLLVLFVGGPKIAQTIVNQSVLSFTGTAISNTTQNTFTLASNGSISNAGSIQADISFPDPLQVFWTNRPNGEGDVLLGTIPMNGVSASGGVATFSQANTFSIKDVATMTTFTAYLNANPSFSWRLVGSPTIKALGVNFKGLSMDKTITLAGFNSFPNTLITSTNVSLSTLSVLSTTVLYNPSTITLDLGTATFNASYNGILLAPLTTSGPVTLYPGNNTLNLSGPANLGAVGVLQPATTNGAKVDVVGAKLVPFNGAQASWLVDAFVGFKEVATVQLTTPSTIS